jgi:RHS repeat-associated protein
VEALWAGFDDGNGWLLHEWQTDTRRYTQSASRWFTPDPLGGDVTNPQSLNRYAYVLNNPTSLTDPMGLQNGVCTRGTAYPPGTPNCTPELAAQSNQGGLLGGIVYGYDIFDALEGSPGTYLTVDMYGNIGFGFSVPLWETTWGVIEGAQSASLSNKLFSVSYPINTSSGFMVFVQDIGIWTDVSGAIPEYLAAVQGLSDLSQQNPKIVDALRSASTAVGIWGLSMDQACEISGCSQALSLIMEAGQIWQVLNPAGPMNGVVTVEPVARFPAPPNLQVPTGPTGPSIPGSTLPPPPQ